VGRTAQKVVEGVVVKKVHVRYLISPDEFLVGLQTVAQNALLHKEW